MPKGGAIRDNLDAPCIGHRHIDIHVCEPHVAGDPRAGLPADSHHSVLEGQGAGGQDPRSGTRGAVVTERAKLPPKAAFARRRRVPAGRTKSQPENCFNQI